MRRIAPGILPAATLPTLVYLDAPWWAILLIALSAMLTAALVRLVDRVLPHDSSNLRGWWNDLWRYRTPRCSRQRRHHQRHWA